MHCKHTVQVAQSPGITTHFRTLRGCASLLIIRVHLYSSLLEIRGQLYLDPMPWLVIKRNHVKHYELKLNEAIQ